MPAMSIYHFFQLRFRDPARSGSHHLGFHPADIEAFVHSDQFKPFLHGLLDDLELTAAQMRQPPLGGRHGGAARILIGAYGTKGRHRSIAAFSVQV